jgi:hypothetical protein
MTTRDRLHRILDALPDAEANALAPVMDALAAYALDPAARAALLAPDDDEPEAERAGVAESLAALGAGDIGELDALRTELGPPSSPAA